jgi:hypothetical protein
MSARDPYVTFVVRLTRTEDGRASGVVERVKTGEKARFQDMKAIVAVIARMLSDRDETG